MTDNVTTLTPKHDPSFAVGWNDLASASRAPEFDHDKYLSGVIAAERELRRQAEERAEVWATHQTDMDEVLATINKLTEVGIFLRHDYEADEYFFCQAQGIRGIETANQPYSNDDLPF